MSHGRRHCPRHTDGRRDADLSLFITALCCGLTARKNILRGAVLYCGNDSVQRIVRLHREYRYGRDIDRSHDHCLCGYIYVSGIFISSQKGERIRDVISVPFSTSLCFGIPGCPLTLRRSSMTVDMIGYAVLFGIALGFSFV